MNATVLESTNGTQQAVLQLPAKVGERIEIAARYIRPLKDQPRQYFDPGEQQALAESMKAENGGRQELDIIVDMPQDPNDPDHPYELCDGECRWRAAMELISPNFILTARVKERLPFIEKFKAAIRANHGRRGHTEQEEAMAIKVLSDAGVRDEEIAANFTKSVSWVHDRKKLLNLVGSVFALLSPRLPEEKRLNSTSALEVTAVHVGLQLAVAQEIIAKKLTPPQVKHLVRSVQIQSEEKGLIKVPQNTPASNRRRIDNLVKTLRDEISLVLDFIKPEDLKAAIDCRTGPENEHLLKALISVDDRIADFTNAVQSLVGDKK